MDVKIVTVDATKGAFEAMIAGTINVAVECNPLLAPQVYEAALKAVNGEDSAGVGALDRGDLPARRLPRRTSRRASTRQVDVTVGKRRIAPLPDAFQQHAST